MLVLGFSGTGEQFELYLAIMKDVSEILPGITALGFAQQHGYRA